MAWPGGQLSTSAVFVCMVALAPMGGALTGLAYLVDDFAVQKAEPTVRAACLLNSLNVESDMRELPLESDTSASKAAGLPMT